MAIMVNDFDETANSNEVRCRVNKIKLVLKIASKTRIKVIQSVLGKYLPEELKVWTANL